MPTTSTSGQVAGWAGGALCTFAGGAGHVEPTLPVARAPRQAGHGLAPADGVLHHHRTVEPVPPSTRDPAHPVPGRAVHVRPAGWSPDRRPEPLVLIILGTVFAPESGELVPRVLTGVQALPVDVLVTVGPALDPAELGPQPSHVRVERHVPLPEVLPRCAAVVSHGGSGTVVAALAAGGPCVVLPMGADQPLKADRVVALGAGRARDAVTATPVEERERLVRSIS